jgi:acetaldehyde dehydrogenase/alcohol dehydrogenase
MTDMIEVPIEAAGVPRAKAMLERAEWAARAYARYDRGSVAEIVQATARAAAAAAKDLAYKAVAETGFGVAEHKVIKNLACSTGLLDHYRSHDYVTPRIDSEAKIVSVPRPAGVVFALTPSTNPVATVYFKTLLCLMTRNAVVISPHPMAKAVCTEAARLMHDAAVAAGAPEGIIQVVEEPSVPLIQALMTDERTKVIVATGGNPVVRSAYRSGNPAIGVGPGNVPVLVDATADLRRAAERIITSKAFDNSILCTNESVLIVEEAVADPLLRAMRGQGGHLLDADQAERIRATVFPNGSFDTKMVGQSATSIAQQAGIRVPQHTRVLLAPFDLVVPEEVLAHEKLCPVVGVVRVASARRGIDVARAVLRISGAGHSAAIHSTDPQTILDFGAAVNVLRVSVNVGNSLGGSGIETNLAPSMTIGTGYLGRSSVGENLQPKHLLNFTRLAYNSDSTVPFADFAGLSPWAAPAGPVPPYPHASNVSTPEADYDPARSAPASDDGEAQLREDLRRLIIEELTNIIKG